MLLRHEQRLDATRIREVIRAHPWATPVTGGSDGLIASHMPAVVDETARMRAALQDH